VLRQTPVPPRSRRDAEAGLGPDPGDVVDEIVAVVENGKYHAWPPS